MRMLDKNDEGDDVEVTGQDQESINYFSMHNQHVDELEDYLKQKKEEKEAIDDLAMELELADEDELVPYKIQSCFVHLPANRVLKMCEKSQETLQSQIDAAEEEMSSRQEEMKALKVKLYSKFGTSINLER